MGHPAYSGINPYALGFNMFRDIRRMCENPTEEDKAWFPDIAGKDWLETIDHAITFVEGNVHTNSVENFWSLLKRTLKGTYVSVDPVHLHAYLDEQAFRFNEREHNDGTRFRKVASSVAGRRLTYAELTGKNGAKPN